MLTAGGLAELERDLIRTRTGEGRREPPRAGRKWGVAQAHPHQRREAIKRAIGAESLADIGRSYDVSGATISWLTL
jgi:DNA invertase Pin-like site-specific DNA recombinase